MALHENPGTYDLYENEWVSMLVASHQHDASRTKISLREKGSSAHNDIFAFKF